MKNHIGLLIVSLFILITSCKKENITPISEISTCDFNSLIASDATNYSFDDALEVHFKQTNRWESIEAMLAQDNNQIELSANGTNISEAWLTATQQMPYNKSWAFSVAVTVPSFWNTESGNEPQVGVGIFAGKPEPTGQSKKVYECNLAVVSNEGRFVQGQLVANRLGGDPIKVDRKILTNSQESAILKLQYCAASHSLTLLIDNERVGVQAIDASGNDNWGLSDTDMIDIGIMGFAENTNIISNFPFMDNFELNIY